MRDGACGGVDGSVPEMWKSLPLLLVLAICDLFQIRILEAADPMDWSWRVIDLLGIPKIKLPESLSDFHFIAKTPVFQKWYLRFVMQLAKQSLSSASAQ
eukprot:9827772-Karenia_brevis.AAC.1